MSTTVPLYRRAERLLFGAIALEVMYLFYNDYDTKKSHFWNFNYSLEDSIMLQMLVVCIMSYTADYFVLGWHADNPPHPKFRMLPHRKICIAMHIIGGSIEIFSFISAFFAQNPTPYAKAAVYAAWFLHIPSSFYQTPIVFGVKKLMVPGYSVFIILHLTASLDLFYDPTNTEKLLKMCVALHGYVWVRVSVFLFKTLGIVKDHEYTLAVLFTGFLNVPMIASPASNFIFICSFVLFHYLNPYLVKWNLAPWGHDVTEYDRETVIFNHTKLEQALMTVVKYQVPSSEKTSKIKMLSDHALAMECFKKWDFNNDGVLDNAEIASLLNSIGYSEHLRQAKIRSFDKDASGAITFHEFYTNFWAEHGDHHDLDKNRLCQQLYKKIDFDLNKKLPLFEQAKLIFEALDDDNSGTLSMEEISDVLVAWGLPITETAAYINRYDKDGNNEIDLGEFFEYFSPMWEYAYKLLEDDIYYYRTIVVEKEGKQKAL